MRLEAKTPREMEVVSPSYIHRVLLELLRPGALCYLSYSTLRPCLMPAPIEIVYFSSQASTVGVYLAQTSHLVTM